MNNLNLWSCFSDTSLKKSVSSDLGRFLCSLKHFGGSVSFGRVSSDEEEVEGPAADDRVCLGLMLGFPFVISPSFFSKGRCFLVAPVFLLLSMTTFLYPLSSVLYMYLFVTWISVRARFVSPCSVWL